VNTVAGNKNVIYKLLVDGRNIILPPLHIKLGLMKTFVKATDRNLDGFQYLKLKFPILSDAKIKEGIFVGPQITELLKDEHFECVSNSLELEAWKSFKNVSEHFWARTEQATINYLSRIYYKPIKISVATWL
jgi:hypothetical protein